MLILIVCGVLSLATDAALGKCIEQPAQQIPDGMSVHKVIATWQEAHLQCLSEGAVLASPINTEVLDKMKSLIGVNNTAYFIGTKATHYPGPFVSVEGIPLYKMTDAVLGMVNLLDPKDGDCLSMDQYSIRVVSCCSRLPYMCYKSKKEENTTTQKNLQNNTTEVTTTEANQEQITVAIDDTDKTPEADNLKLNTTGQYTCGTDDPDYVMRPSTNSCYKKHEEELDWSEAEKTCLSEGGYLAVIDDEDEQQVIMDLYPQSVWWVYIGLRNQGPYVGWKSVHNVPVSDLYNRWIDGTGLKSPNHCCALLKFSGLLDWDYCSTNHPFLCEKKIELQY